MNKLYGHAANQSLAIVYRILGNDLPPRHDKAQTLSNTKFILRHEPRHCGLARGWIINRIMCAETENEIIDLLKTAGEIFVRIPFDYRDYSRVMPDFAHFEKEDYLAFWRGEISEGYKRILVHDHAFHNQNQYVMNVNAARNLALQEGRKYADWVLPWDGNCFLTDDGWAAIRNALVSNKIDYRYLVVPMERILDNKQLFGATSTFLALEEPQIAFRRDAADLFDCTLRYGRYSKVELLRRLGVPGVWDRWEFQPWEKRQWVKTAKHGTWHQAGWVARLASGQPEFDRDPSPTGIRYRSFARRASIRAGLRRADDRLVTDAITKQPGFLVREVMEAEWQAWTKYSDGGSPLIGYLLGEANSALETPTRTVLQKTRCAPNGDWRTYHSVAPFWWPDPAGQDRPYVRRDGDRIPEADIASPSSFHYDSTRFQNVLSDVFVLSCAFYVTSGSAYARKAAAIVDAWFCDPCTSMRPNLDFAQVRRGHPGAGGQPSGVIDARDIYLALEGVRLLERSEHMTPTLRCRFNSWVESYLEWLLESELGRVECLAVNNHGTCYELQVIPLGLFLRNTEVVAAAINRARSRIFQQFTRGGSQAEEELRRTPLHYKIFNLQSWMIVAKYANSAGLPLTVVGGTAESLLRDAVEDVAADVGRWCANDALIAPQPTGMFGRQDCRLQFLLRCAAHLGITSSKCRSSPETEYRWPHPYTGLPPLWQLAFPLSTSTTSCSSMMCTS